MDVNEIRKGCTETLILSLVNEAPMHGYEMAKEIERRSEGYFGFKHSTLYPKLHALERRGLIRGSWDKGGSGRPRKHYRITRAGAEYHARNASSWREFILALTALVPEAAS